MVLIPKIFWLVWNAQTIADWYITFKIGIGIQVILTLRMAHKISPNWRHPPCFLSSRSQFTAFTLPEIKDLVTRVNQRWDDPWSYIENDVKSAYYHQSGWDTGTTHWALKLWAWCGTCAGVNLQWSWQDIITWYLIVKVWAFMALYRWFLLLLHWLPLVCHTHWQGHQVTGGKQKLGLLAVLLAVLLEVPIRAPLKIPIKLPNCYDPFSPVHQSNNSLCLYQNLIFHFIVKNAH